jgi:hypothetical protein
MYLCCTKSIELPVVQAKFSFLKDELKSRARSVGLAFYFLKEYSIFQCLSR